MFAWIHAGHEGCPGCSGYWGEGGFEIAMHTAIEQAFEGRQFAALCPGFNKIKRSAINADNENLGLFSVLGIPQCQFPSGSLTYERTIDVEFECALPICRVL